MRTTLGSVESPSGPTRRARNGPTLHDSKIGHMVIVCEADACDDQALPLLARTFHVYGTPTRLNPQLAIMPRM
jgi:hypothetical protein